MGNLARSLDRLKAHYDVVIVGSGYGGGVSASRLARAGKSVAVLERGREVRTGEFPARFPDLRADLQVRGKRLSTGPETALFDVRVGEDMNILTGCGLGGGSLVNAGVALVPERDVLADAAWPSAMRADRLLEEGFARANAWVRPATDPHAATRTKFRALEACAAATGERVVPSPVAITFADAVSAGGIAQKGCTLCGDCCGGCNVGAKNTVALTYLPDAKRHGAELFTHAKVSHVEKLAGGGWRVALRRSDDKSSEQLAVTADIVILAAGTLGSTEILLRSREKGLALSDQLGKRFSANGDIIAFGYGAKLPVNAVGVGEPSKVPGLEIGASVTGQIEVRGGPDFTHSVNIEEGALPSAMAPVLPVLFIPNGRLLGALQSLVSGVYKGPFASLQTFFAVSHDDARGVFTLDGDRLSLAWPGAKDQPVYARLDAALTAVVNAAGGSYVKNPLAGTVMGHQPATAHPLGGCGMGEDRGSGVVDHKSRVFDGSRAAGGDGVHEGLYVIDGAIIPRSLGVNPLLTITALSERAMMLFAADHGLSFDAAPATAALAAAAE
jgi:cholesterol oxidase